MKRFVMVIGAMVLSAAADGAVAAGENLLINGIFDAEQVDFPQFWSATPSRSVVYHRTGGPDGGKPAVALVGSADRSGTVSLRQQGLTLVEGETYKLSAYVKTKGFSSRHAGVIVHNSGWATDTGFKSLPADSEWTFMERTFTLFPSKGREYGVAVFAVDPTGELHVADIRFEAVSDGARQGSSSQMALLAAARLVPYRPLLHRIPLANPELTLKAYGVLPAKPEAYECLVTVGGNRIPRQTLPLRDGGVTVRLPGLPAGDHVLEAVLRERGTGQSLVEVSYPITLVDLPVVDRAGMRRLNTLVTELLSRPLAAAAAPQSFTVANPRDGWVFIALESAAPGPRLSVAIDSVGPVITAGTARLEAFRELPMGEHRITVEGCQGGGRLIVRSIPEIFNYPPCVDSYVKENGSYGWEFMQRHILPAVTTLNGGQLPGTALEEAKGMGLKWLANFNVAPVDDPDGLRERLEQHAGMTQPQYDGVTSDELFFARATIDNYTKALWALRNPANRLVYTWIVGKPSIPALHTDFMSACLNVSRSRGRLLFEAYCHPQADEQAAAAYLDNMIAETMRQFSAYLPDAVAGTGMIFGNFNQIPIISLEHNPAVDFKYFLDMQVNLVANSPEFSNLATVGYWGTYYGDEELVRWSFKLMRHYAVEGNRDMLSDRYGFTYKPALVANGDFADDLDGWGAAPAAEGSIRTTAIPGYGKDSQGRWGGGKAGDTVCVMVRGAGAPNRISQTATGLKVGRAYCLQFVTGDLNDITGKRHNPRHYGIRAELPGADILADRGFVHVDRRKTHRRLPPDSLAKIALNRIVFRATSTEQTVAFSDAEAVPGEELVLNFVQLKPYLE